MSDVGAVLHAVEADAMHGFVGAGDGRFQVCGAGGHAQHPAASGDDLAIDELGSGVEDLHAGRRRWRAQCPRWACRTGTGRDSRRKP